MEDNERKDIPFADNGSEKKRKNVIVRIILILAVVGVVCAAVLIILNEIDNKRQEQNQAAIHQDAYSTTAPVAPDATPVPTPEPIVVEPHWYEGFARTPDRVINFAELRAKNPDIYAWINIPGLEIDYPVVHTFTFDETYLSYDAYLQENKMGAIYSDGWNLGDLSDRVTFFYGHNMKSGTMFAGLHRFRDAVFFNEHDTIKVYMDDIELNYKVFAAYITSNEHVLMKNNFNDDAVYSEYLANIMNARDLSSNYRDVELSVDDRILTLCTCVKDHSDQRLFVQAVLMPNE